MLLSFGRRAWSFFLVDCKAVVTLLCQATEQLRTGVGCVSCSLTTVVGGANRTLVTEAEMAYNSRAGLNIAWQKLYPSSQHLIKEKGSASNMLMFQVPVCTPTTNIDS